MNQEDVTQEKWNASVDGETFVNKTPADIVIVIRPSLKRACCEGDACRAAVFNQILYSIAWKHKQGKDHWYGTYQCICSTLLDDCWSQKKVIKEIKALVDQGFIEQRHNPARGWDQTRQYLFGEKQAEKFREACEKAGVCILHHINFPEEVLHLVNLPNANGKNAKCICSIYQMDLADLPNANGKFTTAIPKTTTKTSSKTTTEERKNGTSSQKPNIATQEESHSSIHSSFSSIKLTEDEQRMMDFAKKNLFKAKTPEITEKLKNECAELAPHIKTQQQFDSLLDHVKEKLQAPYHLKNMVNALNDWLQTQPSTDPTKSKEPSLLDKLKAAQRRAEESRLQEEQAVSDEELAEEIRETARIYQDEDNFEEHLTSIKSFRKHFKLSNYDLCDKIVNARRRARPEQSDMQGFFYELRRMVV